MFALPGLWSSSSAFDLAVEMKPKAFFHSPITPLLYLRIADDMVDIRLLPVGPLLPDFAPFVPGRLMAAAAASVLTSN